MFGFPHVEGDVTQPKDVRHVGGQVLLLSLTGVRNHRTARQNQRVRQNYLNRRSCIINITGLENENSLNNIIKLKYTYDYS